MTLNDLGPKEWEQFMKDLASDHRNTKITRYNTILDYYNQVAYKKLNRIRDHISQISTDIIVLIPAARWLFDNFQMMYREIKKFRASGTSYELLPILKDGDDKGYPRVYILAKTITQLSGGHLNEENIHIMLSAYQKELPLTDREIWVLPEMLGFCLLENIIELAQEIIHIIKIKSKADRFVHRKQGNQQGLLDITPLLTELDQECRHDFNFHSHVIHLLKNRSADEISLQRYLDYHFKSFGRLIKPSDVFTAEGKIESQLEAYIRALIISLRDIDDIDTEAFFDACSYLEHILSKDPEGVYSRMDSESRGMYRQVIVKLSRKYKIKEEKIADACLELAVQGVPGMNCSHHVGVYLLGKGYRILRAKLLGKPVPDKTEKKNWKGFLYFAALTGIFLCLNALILAILIRCGIGNYDTAVFRPLPGVSPTAAAVFWLLAGAPLLMGISLEINNFIFTRNIQVKKIPSMNYIDGIPEEARTFVVMPVIVSSPAQAVGYMDRLQKHYLANRQPNLYYALLVDHKDAQEEYLAEDKVVEEALLNRLEELNRLYPSAHPRFSLFIRYRKWNASEKCYMCWERKRGKLEEFNNLLSGVPAENTTFSLIRCDRELLAAFRYVITLDSDTDLIRDNAAKLVGLIDHPMNRPVLDEEGRKVKEGYAIIQPMVRNHIVNGRGSRFAKLFGGQTGMVYYATAVSDIYQDIFDQGIYIGKGIYDIHAFHRLLNGVIPENRVLSHDLLESCYARTAFSSSARVMDNFPGSVIAYAKREHRWIRGDWQLFPWLFRSGSSGGRGLCALSRWKVLDNLRRSLVPVSKLLIIVLNLVTLPRGAMLWVPLVFFSDLFQITVLILSIAKQKLLRPKLALVYKGLKHDLGAMLECGFLEFVIIPYRAYIALDAMLRTLFRLYISRRNLLRWNTAEAVDSQISNTVRGYFLTMSSCAWAAGILLLLLWRVRISPLGLALYGSTALCWASAFYLSYGISQPEGLKNAVKPEDRAMLLEASRRTWMFFKEYSKPENHDLCPDNYQIARVEKISDKTSPTNIGLQFLSILTARDLGFETLSGTVERIERLMDTVQRLEKWKGHLFNWYHIKTLEVLNPAYISTVDSGNFLGHLVALKNGLLEMLKQPIFTKNFVEELRMLLKLSHYEGELSSDYTMVGEFCEAVAGIREDLQGRSIRQYEDSRWIRELEKLSEETLQETMYYMVKGESLSGCPSLEKLSEKGNKNAIAMADRIRRLAGQIDAILADVDFTFLYDSRRMLFHIGYHVSSQTLDAGCYDLMASESALTSFLAIAGGSIPQKHWFKLGRPLTMVRGIPCFVSWSGTMFEYLMPNLVLKEYEDSVFAETSRAAVLQQIKYAKEAGIPWGISESQYYRFDLNANYQYKAFGVPKLRLQPVRKNSLVAAPYACMLALEYAPEDCFANLRRLKDLGVYGEYGFYEAIDYNSPDASEMTPYCIVRSFMAHHQGMNLVAINNFLNEGIMRNRFHSEAMVKATESLLEERRRSHLISIAKQGYTIKINRSYFKEEAYSSRYVNGISARPPVTNYLSNGQYSLLITSDGDGFGCCRDLMLYRWRPDLYANSGNYIYIKDTGSRKVWSSTYHPTKTEPVRYQAVFSPHQALFMREDAEIATQTVVSLDANRNMEIRRVTVANHSKEDKVIELTSYLEVVGDTHLAERSHPAFNKLFMESEFLEEQGIFLSRRRSGKGVSYPYIMHMVRSGVKPLKRVEYENDRLRFLGRNNTPAHPAAVVNSYALSNQAGFCNDPIMSLRVTIALDAGESASVSFITGICGSREEAVLVGQELSRGYHVDDIFEKFKLQKELELKYLEISKAQIIAFQELITPIYYPVAIYRGPRESIRRNHQNQSFLWRFGVSGDNPIMLLRVKSLEDAELIRDTLKAYEYMKMNRVAVDLILLSEAKHGYLQELDELVNDLTSSLRLYDSNNDRPSLFLLHSYQMVPAEIDLLLTVARVVISNRTGIYFMRRYKENLLTE